VVKWETSLRKDAVDLADCQKYDNEVISNRNRKATDFYQNVQVKKSKIRKSKKSEESLGTATWSNEEYVLLKG
jgi:hypothetical protein